MSRIKTILETENAQLKTENRELRAKVERIQAEVNARGDRIIAIATAKAEQMRKLKAVAEAARKVSYHNGRPERIGYGRFHTIPLNTMQELKQALAALDEGGGGNSAVQRNRSL